MKPAHKMPIIREWADPHPRLLRADLPAPPQLLLHEVLGPRLAKWIADAAEAKGAPPDYVFATLLAVAGSAIGNARWASPWPGWAEPPILWTMCIGLPSAGKSPAIDAALAPLQRAELALRTQTKLELQAWEEQAELAKLVEAAWKEAAKASIKEGDEPPARPAGLEIGPAPHIPRLVVSDGTIERLGAILSRQPRGTLQVRDELAGWLAGMARYSGGGSDRPFWLEAYGGRSFTVERMSREPLTIDHLSIGVVGGIQPDRLRTLLFKSDDDGLLARFLPIWPHPAPLKRPGGWADEALLDGILIQLLSLKMGTDENGKERPRLIPFSEGASERLQDFREVVRGCEAGAEGLLLSFTGKLPGLAVRLSLVLALLDWAEEGAEEPQEIGAVHFGRAAFLIDAYFLPMARRAYVDASTPKGEWAARRLLALIRERGWEQFSSRDVLRLDRQGLGSADEVNPALVALEEGDCIRSIECPPGPRGGRPQRWFLVNPALIAGAR